jgi:ankyrin repeat protein
MLVEPRIPDLASEEMSIDSRNASGKTPLRIATEIGNVKLFDLFLNKNADCRKWMDADSQCSLDESQ